VTLMTWMFYNALSFNQPLNNWDVSSVTEMMDMFYGAEAFNQPLNNWDVSSVTTMQGMFYGAVTFDQPLDNWDVSSVTNMVDMFRDAVAFSQLLEHWDVISVIQFGGMFAGSGSNHVRCWRFGLDVESSSSFISNGLKGECTLPPYRPGSMDAMRRVLDKFCVDETEARSIYGDFSSWSMILSGGMPPKRAPPCWSRKSLNASDVYPARLSASRKQPGVSKFQFGEEAAILHPAGQSFIEQPWYMGEREGDILRFHVETTTADAGVNLNPTCYSVLGGYPRMAPNGICDGDYYEVRISVYAKLIMKRVHASDVQNEPQKFKMIGKWNHLKRCPSDIATRTDYVGACFRGLPINLSPNAVQLAEGFPHTFTVEVGVILGSGKFKYRLGENSYDHREPTRQGVLPGDYRLKLKLRHGDSGKVHGGAKVTDKISIISSENFQSQM